MKVPPNIRNIRMHELQKHLKYIQNKMQEMDVQWQRSQTILKTTVPYKTYLFIKVHCLQRNKETLMTFTLILSLKVAVNGLGMAENTGMFVNGWK